MVRRNDQSSVLEQTRGLNDLKSFLGDKEPPEVIVLIIVAPITGLKENSYWHQFLLSREP